MLIILLQPIIQRPCVLYTRLDQISTSETLLPDKKKKKEKRKKLGLKNETWISRELTIINSLVVYPAVARAVGVNFPKIAFQARSDVLERLDALAIR